MKNKFLKSLLLGMCFSFLVSTGSFAISQNTNDDKNHTNYEFSIVDALLNQEIESGYDYYDKFCVIIRLGNNFGENAGYYKLDLVKTFGTTIIGHQIKELTCPQYTGISEDGGGCISFSSKTGDGGGCLWLDPEDLLLMGITPDNVHYDPEIGYLTSIDKLHICILYFEKLYECPSGGVELYQPYSDEELIEMVKKYREARSQYVPEFVTVEGNDDTDNTGYTVKIHLYDITKNHVTTNDWYSINRCTGKGTDILNNVIDLTKN